MDWKDRAKKFYRDTLGIQQYKQVAKTALLEQYDVLKRREAARMPQNIALRGYKVYSQNDEDGIISAIFEVVKGNRTFFEIGVEDGKECNTHLLALSGWRGQWIDGNTASYDKIKLELGGDTFNNFFRVINKFIFPHNIANIYRECCAFLSVNDIEFFSLDVDGNDAFILQALLASGARPSVICVEYNGKFPPDVDISIAYRANGGWQGNDYFGASLGCFDVIFARHGYRLITCNITGVNAFYVHETLAADLPLLSAKDAWHPLRLDLAPLPAGHRPSLGFLRDAVNGRQATSAAVIGGQTPGD